MPFCILHSAFYLRPGVALGGFTTGFSGTSNPRVTMQRSGKPDRVGQASRLPSPHGSIAKGSTAR